VWEPLDFLARLAASVPVPRAQLVTYRGVLAPAAAMRAVSTPARRSGIEVSRQPAAGVSLDESAQQAPA
jgi:hypothetical protein